MLFVFHRAQAKEAAAEEAVATLKKPFKLGSQALGRRVFRSSDATDQEPHADGDTLRLSHIPVSVKEASELGGVLEAHQHISRLAACSVSADDFVVVELAKALKTAPFIKHLDLSHNTGIGARHSFTLTTVLCNTPFRAALAC